MFCFRRTFSHIFRFMRNFFLYVLYDVLYEYTLRACYRRASSDVYYHHRTLSTASTRKHSTVQHSAVNPRNKQQSKYAPIRARPRRLADGVDSRQHVVEHIDSSLCSQNERRNRNLLGLQKCCWWCDARRVCLYTHCSFLFRPYMRRPGCSGGPWSSWHLQVAIIVCAEKRGPLCAIQSLAFCSILLCERA